MLFEKKLLLLQPFNLTTHNTVATVPINSTEESTRKELHIPSHNSHNFHLLYLLKHQITKKHNDCIQHKDFCTRAHTPPSSDPRRMFELTHLRLLS
jgi:hypothetical protein